MSLRRAAREGEPRPFVRGRSGLAGDRLCAVTIEPESSRSVAERKERLRRELRGRLERLGAEHARRAASAVADRALALPELAAAKGVLACLSFGSEIDTWDLFERLLASVREVFVPRADPRDGRLHVHRYPCELTTLSFGLRQPPRGAPELAVEEIDGAIDVVLVLGLGFDRRGFRLGHGSGYFDRFLARHSPFALGLAFDVQLRAELPTAPHDVALAAVATERGLWRAPVGSPRR